MLRVRKVAKIFGGLVANNDISLEICKGEIMGLIGPNGSGKTTLINIITGIYMPTRGEIYYLGNRIDGLQPDTIASMGIMRTFQVAKVFRDMTVLENMLIPGFTEGQSRQEAENRADELLSFALLTHLKHEPAKSLSGGQSMLLQIVRGFMRKNLKFYVMDEPFAGVHPSIKGIIIKSIKLMNRNKGVTFLIVSHEMTTIASLCKRIMVLDKGECIAEGTMKDVANNPKVIDAYLGG